jgi:radical SAM protein with 4Fe4S-binding SPASM domain
MIKIHELVIYPLSKCNLRCEHCYVDNAKQYELSSEDLLWIKDNFETRKVIIMGGEPLLYGLLEEILNLFDNVTISTNSLLVPKKINVLKEYRDKITMQISIEGGKEETNAIRGNNKIDVWSECMTSARLLKDNLVKFYFRCSYHSGNLRNIYDEVFGLKKKFGVDLMFLPRVDEPPLGYDEQIEFFKEVLSHKCIVFQPHFFRFIGKNGRCKAGNERLNVYFDKRITPCNLELDYTIGHIYDDPVKIKNNMKIFVENFKELPFQCTTCKHADGCGGSCYIAKSYLHCPLRDDFTIKEMIIHEKLDSQKTFDNVNRLTEDARNLGVC